MEAKKIIFNSYKKYYYLVLINVLALQSFAQGNDNFIIPKSNSKSTIEQTIAATKIEIIYNRPNKKGREIFGDLVSFNKIWRTGSDQATEIYLSTPLKLEGNSIDSGRYELFTVPGKEKWEIIFQKNNNQWGSYRYNEDNDVLRFSVVPKKSMDVIETFTISIDNVSNNTATLNLSWDNTIVPIEIEIDLKTTVVPKLEELILTSDKPPYFHAAMFYYDNDMDIERSAELMALALKMNPGHLGMLYRQALILKRKGDIGNAIKAAEQSLAAAQNVPSELKDEYTRLNTMLLEELKK